MTSTELTTVQFHGANLIAIKGDSPETTMIALRPVVEGMGLDWSGQYRRVMRHPVLSEGVAMTPTPSAGGMQETTCLPLSRLNFWLATVDAARVKPELRDKVIAYQRECADVLFRHFFGQATGGAGEISIREKLAVVREARVTGGKAAAARVWNEIGLPGAMEAEHQDDRIDRMVVTVRDMIDRAGPQGVTEKELLRRKGCQPLSDLRAALGRLPAAYALVNVNESKTSALGHAVKGRMAWVRGGGQ